jgi:hypothetical protein
VVLAKRQQIVVVLWETDLSLPAQEDGNERFQTDTEVEKKAVFWYNHCISPGDPDMATALHAMEDSSQLEDCAAFCQDDVDQDKVVDYYMTES